MRDIDARNPPSSPITQKIKSVWCSGTKFNRFWVPHKRPFPHSSPEPTAILDWIAVYPEPSGSALILMNVNNRVFWYPFNICQITGSDAIPKINEIKIYLIFAPHTKSMQYRIGKNIRAVPKSGCLTIKISGIKVRRNDMINRFFWSKFCFLHPK